MDYYINKLLTEEFRSHCMLHPMFTGSKSGHRANKKLMVDSYYLNKIQIIVNGNPTLLQGITS